MSNHNILSVYLIKNQRLGTVVELTRKTLGIPKGDSKGKLVRLTVVEDKLPPNVTISSTYIKQGELL